MPYSSPSSPPLPVARPPRARRTRSAGTYFSDERGPGAFASLGSLPRRTKPGGPPPPKKSPVFHFNEDDDDDYSHSTSHSDDSDDSDSTAPVNFPTPRNERFRLAVNTRNLSPPLKSLRTDLAASTAIPFPTSSPPSPTQITRSTSLLSPRCSTTSPIVLSNGKPLKSSLKSSSSAPSIPHSHRTAHSRVRSEPATPSLAPKNVHFKEKECGLETVTVFSKRAKPASLGTPGGDDTETEAEHDSDRPPIRSGPYLDSFPFPRLPPSTPSPLSKHSPQVFELDPGGTSTIPAPSPPPYSNIHLESVSLSSSASSTRAAPILTGTLVVRNIAYEKHVAVRFTLDEWQTTSEVSGRHLASLQSLPHALQPRTLGDAVSVISSRHPKQNESAVLWDRFSFTIRLEDYAHNLNDRVLWLVARFTSSGFSSGEWWDNNGGQNYRVGFRIRNEAPSVSGVGVRRNVTSAPAIPMKSQQSRSPSPEKTSPPITNPTPPSMSPVERRNSLLAATTNRLSKFSLMNYAAPSPASRSMISDTPRPQPTPIQERQNRGILTPPDSPSDSNDTTPPQTPEFGKDHRDLPSVQTQMIGAHPATVGPSEFGYGFDVPVNYRDEGLPRGSSDSLYKAFVARWCFAEGPPPGVSGLPGYGLGTEVSVGGIN